MIVACPGCKARYQIEPDRLRPEGVRLRCTRCEAVFRVSPPPAAARTAADASDASMPSEPVPQPESPRQPAPSLDPPISRPAPPAPPSTPVDRTRAVLVADPEIEQGKATASALVQWGLQPTLVHDGVEAMLAIQRLLPRAIVIDAALPKMFGFQICEIVKRNESLRNIHVVLVGAIHNRARYRRAPEEIYGADAYIERQELPTSLRSILQGFGMLSAPSDAPVAPAAAVPLAPEVPLAPAATVAPIAPEVSVAPAAPAAPIATEVPMPPIAPIAPEVPEDSLAAAAPPTPAVAESGPATSPIASPPPQPRADVAPPEPASADPAVDEKIAQAERLARIVVSDIVLYSKEKFEAAVATGNVLEAMQPELAEGRSLFTARVDPSIQQLRDFLAEELLRVAGAKGKP